MFGPLSELSNRLDWLREEMNPSYFPPLNVWEEGDTLFVEAEVPGLKIEDIAVSFDNGELTLKGEKKVVEKENAPMHRRERLTGTFTRTVTIPWDIMGDRVTAELKDGVLTVTLPKAETSKPRRVEVKYQEPK